MHDDAFQNATALQSNAWTGTASATSALAPGRAGDWCLNRVPAANESQGWRGGRAPQGIKDWNWQSLDVGWGLVLPDDDSILPIDKRATADDAPEPIQRLVAARRNAPVLRWREREDGGIELRRYDGHGGYRPLQAASPVGMGERDVPRYLLIYAPPSRIPWRHQYTLNLSRHVGRLWLHDEALDNYISALLSDWAGATCNPRVPLVWSVDHGQPDITWLMHRTISRKLADAWASDCDLAQCRSLFGDEATGALLTSELARLRPGLVVTSSHGMTGPLQDPVAMAAQLGMPVDVAHRVLDMDALCERWQPDGAIWYSHGCCAAGSDTASDYDGLFDPGSDVARVLSGVAAGCGASIAPLPQRLLGMKRPLRAFIGHVEPTFNWTLLDPVNHEQMTHSLQQALYSRLFEDGERRPIGYAMGRVFSDVGGLLSHWERAARPPGGAAAQRLDAALHYKVSALDRQHTVILGDPTVALPALNGAAGGARSSP